MEVAPALIARVATAENVIVSKLWWPKRGATEQSADDIRGIVRARGAELDLGYLEEMAREMGRRRSGLGCGLSPDQAKTLLDALPRAKSE